MKNNLKIYIAGRKGMVGSAIWRTLIAEGYANLIGVSSAELDLRNQEAVRDFMLVVKPDVLLMQQHEWEAFWLTIIILINF